MINSRELRPGNKAPDKYYDSFKTIINVESINEVGVNLAIEDEMKRHLYL